MFPHFIKTFVQNTTFLGSVCKSIVTTGILTGYSVSHSLSLGAEVTTESPKPSAISLAVFPSVGTRSHPVQSIDNLHRLTQMY